MDKFIYDMFDNADKITYLVSPHHDKVYKSHNLDDTVRRVIGNVSDPFFSILAHHFTIFTLQQIGMNSRNLVLKYKAELQINQKSLSDNTDNVATTIALYRMFEDKCDQYIPWNLIIYHLDKGILKTVLAKEGGSCDFLSLLLKTRRGTNYSR